MPRKKPRVIWMFDDEEDGLYDGYWDTKKSCLESNNLFIGRAVKFIEERKG